MQNRPEFTAYALGEHENQEEFKLQLLEEGHSEEEIELEAKKVRDIAAVVKEEFKKDDSIRLSVEQREKLFPKQQKRNWMKIFGITGAAALVTLTSVSLLEQNKKTGANQSKLPSIDSVFNSSEVVLDEIEGGSERAKVSSNKPVKVSSNEARRARQGMPKGKSLKKKFGGNRAMMEADFAGASIAGSGGMVADDEMFIPAPGTPFPDPQVQPKETSNREAYDKIDVNPYLSVAQNPLSTFSVDVDTASYSNMRRFLEGGNLPPKDSIRVEEIINYFNYDYKMDYSKHPVAVDVAQADSPWTKGRKIVRVGLQTDMPKDLLSANKNLVFLLDVSGSMNNYKKLPLLKESLKILLKKMDKNDTISIVVYAGASGVVLEPTPASERLKILKALDNLSAGGSTNGGAGIEAAYKLAKQGFIKNGVNRVILATDGDFNIGTTSQSELIDLVEEKAKDDIFLTVVGLGMGNYQDSMLEKLSNRGNGNYAYIDSIFEANKLFNVDLEKNLVTVAKDVKVQVEFNPAKVEAYRLIGYENRKLAAQDFNNDKKDAGEMGAGHSVTALYEIVPKGQKIDLPKIDKLKYAKEVKQASDSNDLLTVKIRYKLPTETKSVKFEKSLEDKKIAFEKANQEFRFATAAASFAMKLRGDKLVKGLSYRDIESMAKESRGPDINGFREDMINLIKISKEVDR